MLVLEHRIYQHIVIMRSPKNLLCRLLLLVALCGAGAPWALQAQSANIQYQVANLMEDVRLLDERMRQLSIQLEDMRRENARLRDLVRDYESQSDQNMAKFVSGGQLNEAVRQAVSSLESRDNAMKKEILAEVSKTMEEFAKRVEKALGSVQTIERPDPNVKRHFSKEGIPTTGTPYVVQPGDNISRIASKFNSRSDWIQNINEISDPRLLQVGQAIFVPHKAE